jgi:type I restriction enzyme M protein
MALIEAVEDQKHELHNKHAHTLDEIATNDHNLNIPRYVEPKVEQEPLILDQAMERLRDAAAAFAAEDKLSRILQHEGLLTGKG